MKNRWTHPEPYESVAELLHAPGLHPDLYDGLWCNEHTYRMLERSELLDALNKKARTIRTKQHR